jgi:hypothetical protein
MKAFHHRAVFNETFQGICDRGKLNDLPYRIAQKAEIHPNVLSKLLNGAERIKPADERVLAVAGVLNLEPGRCFEFEGQSVEVPA